MTAGLSGDAVTKLKNKLTNRHPTKSVQISQNNKRLKPSTQIDFKSISNLYNQGNLKEAIHETKKQLILFPSTIQLYQMLGAFSSVFVSSQRVGRFMSTRCR